MQSDFWLERWEKGETPFHLENVHPFLRHFYDLLAPAGGERVFLPLCGKSRDLLWLHRHGHPVLGVELSPLATAAFFAENGLLAEADRHGPFERRRWERLTLLGGDFFALSPAELAGVGAVFDRGALGALPPELRRRYAARLADLLEPGCRVLLVLHEYDRQEMDGPPFAVDARELRELCGAAFAVEPLAREDFLAAAPQLQARGLTALQETAYLLERR